MIRREHGVPPTSPNRAIPHLVMLSAVCGIACDRTDGVDPYLFTRSLG